MLRARGTALASTDLIGRSHPALADVRDLKWVAGGLIIGAISFNAALCFLNTRGIAITNFHVIFSEMLLISCAVIAARYNVNIRHISVITVIILYTAGLSIVRYSYPYEFGPNLGFNPKIGRDLIIPFAFFLLGKAVKNTKTSDNVVFAATALVLVFAIFEYFFLDTFLKVFGVAEYYIARGSLHASENVLNASQGLMVSGIRPADQGRTLLPFLGDHRVSSIFLEPISLGNFGTLVTLWAVVRTRMEGRLYIWCALSGLALLVLSDTRFDAYFLALAIPIMMAPHRITTPLIAILPFIVIVALYLLGASADHYNGLPALSGRGAYERLLYSGGFLFDFDVFNWFGLEARPYTEDSGYAYVISNVGIVGFAALWTLFMSLEGSSRYFFSFRNVAALYFVALSCISSSYFTIKMGALLWFLLGVLSDAKGTPRRGTRREVLPAGQLA